VDKVILVYKGHALATKVGFKVVNSGKLLWANFAKGHPWATGICTDNGEDQEKK